jgi:hypothetical protein
VRTIKITNYVADRLACENATSHGDCHHGCFHPHQVREPSFAANPTNAVELGKRDISTLLDVANALKASRRDCVEGCCGDEIATVNAISAARLVPSDQGSWISCNLFQKVGKSSVDSAAGSGTVEQR